MSDHDASPKEWTQSHSMRHGPQKWLPSSRRSGHKAPHPFATLPMQFAYPPVPAVAAKSRRTSSVGSAPAMSDELKLLDASFVGVDAIEAPLPQEDIEEEEQENDGEMHEAVDAWQRMHASQQQPTSVHRYSMPAPAADRRDLRRLASAPSSGAVLSPPPLTAFSPPPPPHQVPMARSRSDVDVTSPEQARAAYAWSWTIQEQMHQHQMSELPHPPQHCATCIQLESASQSAQYATMPYMTMTPVHHPLGGGGGDSFSARSSQSTFTPYRHLLGGPALPPPFRAYPQSAVQSPTAAAGHHGRRLPAMTSPHHQQYHPRPQTAANQMVQEQQQQQQQQHHAHNASPYPQQKQQQHQPHQQQSQPHQVAPPSSLPAAPSSSPPPPPPVVAPSGQTLLPRWFLVLLAVLKETDGRDKLGKMIQYGGRTMRNLLQRLPQLAWWAGFIWRHAQVGAIARILRAANILLVQATPPSSTNAPMAIGGGGKGAAGAALAGGLKAPSAGNFSLALRSSYAADTAAISRSLSSSPLYSGTIARLEVLTAALSSARRVIRVCKWTYTLPGWCKTFTAWRTQVQEGVERDLLRRQREEEEASERAASGDQPPPPPVSRAVQVASAVAAPFRFSHPHPTHVWRRLPWLSSVELLDLSIAVATDMADDLEWLSKYRLFPGELGYKCGRLAVCLWFTTVVLDLALTFRVIRHYQYQRRQIRLQMDTAQAEYHSGCLRLQAHQRLREEKEYRRLARELKQSPFVKRARQPDHHHRGEQHAPLPADLAPLVRSTDSDPHSPSSSWSQLTDPTGQVVSGSEGGPSSSGSNRSSTSDGRDADGKDPAAALVDSPPKSPLAKPPALTVQAADGEDANNEAAADDGGVSSDEDADVEAASESHALTVGALDRLSSLHHQLAAVQVSLGLQHLNFAKFLADLGCALPMALNVHKEWDGVVQFTGLISGGLGAYKLVLDKNNALTR